jgi:hypothetical protein
MNDGNNQGRICQELVVSDDEFESVTSGSMNGVDEDEYISADENAACLTWSYSALDSSMMPPSPGEWDPVEAAVNGIATVEEAAKYPLPILDAIPIFKERTFSDEVNAAALKMTCDQHGIPYPANIDEPYVSNIYLNLQPNPAEIHLGHLIETAKLYDDQFPLPEDVNFTPHLQHYREYHDHSRELPADPIMDLIPDQELLEQEPEHTLLYDLQVGLPSMIFEEVEAPPGWYPEPSAINPDDPSDIAPEPLASSGALPYIVARQREPEPRWIADQYATQYPPLMAEFGYGHGDWNEAEWLSYNQDWNTLGMASMMPPPQAPSQTEPRPRRRRRRQKPSAAKPVEPEPVPAPPTEEEPDVVYVSLPLPEPEPMPVPESVPNEPILTGWAGNVRDFLCALVNHAFDRTPEEISMLHYLNF